VRACWRARRYRGNQVPLVQPNETRPRFCRATRFLRSANPAPCNTSPPAAMPKYSRCATRSVHRGRQSSKTECHPLPRKSHPPVSFTSTSLLPLHVPRIPHPPLPHRPTYLQHRSPIARTHPTHPIMCLPPPPPPRRHHHRKHPSPPPKHHPRILGQHAKKKALLGII